MSIVSYERFDKDGIELVINTQTGESFATQAGYSRMSGVPKTTISSRMGGVRKDNFKSAEIQTGQGIQGVRLIDENTMADWLEKDNPSLLKKFSKLGIRASLHKLAGFEVQSTAIANIPKSYGEALLEAGRLQLELEKAQAEKELLEQENELLSEAVDELFDYSSIVRIAKFNDVSETKFKWRKLKAMSLFLKKEIKRVPCPRFEWKNLYSHDVWRLCYPDANLPETTTLVIKH
jgi:hypothetical protein